jgi:fumarate reductase subunit D
VPRPADPFWWLLFGAGGFVAALLAPVLILLTGIAAPAGWIDRAVAYDRLLTIIAHPLARLLLFGLISLSFLHGAHRLRYTLPEGFGLERASAAVAVVCYGTAVAGTLAAAVILLGF